MLESLESRTLLAADPLAEGLPTAVRLELRGRTVEIETLSADNTIELFKNGRHLQVNITTKVAGQAATSTQQNLYDINKVRSIEISSGAGNDVISVSKKVKIPVRVDAGSGSDTVSTGSGNDTIYGGDHLDYLVGNAGDDVIDGGEGDDRLFATGGNDHLFGNLGNDRLTVSTTGHTVDGGLGRDVGTLRAAPNRIARVERFTENAYDLVPVKAAPNARIEGFNFGGNGAVTMDVHSYDNVYATSVRYKGTVRRLIVDLLPYRIVTPPDTQVDFVGTQTIDLGRLQPGSYSVSLQVFGKAMDYKTFTVGDPAAV